MFFLCPSRRQWGSGCHSLARGHYVLPHRLFQAGSETAATFEMEQPQEFIFRGQSERSILSLFECFVYSEIAKLCNDRDDGHEFYYWSPDNRAEVDIVIQYDGKIVGVEVKRRRSARPEDFVGLMKLAGEAKNMHRGIVIHTGEHFYNMKALGEASGLPMQAIPAAWLWTKPAAEQLDILKHPAAA